MTQPELILLAGQETAPAPAEQPRRLLGAQALQFAKSIFGEEVERLELSPDENDTISSAMLTVFDYVIDPDWDAKERDRYDGYLQGMLAGLSEKEISQYLYPSTKPDEIKGTLADFKNQLVHARGFEQSVALTTLEFIVRGRRNPSSVTREERNSALRELRLNTTDRPMPKSVRKAKAKAMKSGVTNITDLAERRRSDTVFTDGERSLDLAADTEQLQYELSLVPQPKLAQRTGQLLRMVYQGAIDEEVSAIIDFEDDAREVFVDIAVGQLYANNMRQGGRHAEQRLARLERYFSTADFSSPEQAEWFFHEEASLLEDLRDFNKVMRVAHEFTDQIIDTFNQPDMTVAQLLRAHFTDQKPEVVFTTTAPKPSREPVQTESQERNQDTPETLEQQPQKAVEKAVAQTMETPENKAAQTAATVERQANTLLEPLLTEAQRREFAHVDIFRVALRPGSVSRPELMGAINSMWGRAVDANLLKLEQADYLRNRLAGNATDIELPYGVSSPLHLLESMLSTYPGRLTDDRLSEIMPFMRRLTKQFAMGREIREIKARNPGAPVPLLVTGGISEVLRTAEKKRGVR